MEKYCPYCETELTDRDPDDFCCPDRAFEALRDATIELCDYLFEQGDNGDYITGSTWGDVNVEEILPKINRALNY